jgi:DNA mismatch repair protein MLH3
MFNDQLSIEECNDVLRRLSECALPFQCAHGRPSLVPIADLGSHFPTATGLVDEQGAGVLGKRLESWMASKKSDILNDT